MDTIPTLSFTRVPFQALREAAENSPIGLRVARNFIRLPSAVDEGQVSMKAFDPTDTFDNGAVGLYRMLMYTENRRTAASVVQTYVDGNLADKIRIFRQATMDTLLSMSREFGGHPEDMKANDLNAIKEVVDNFTGGAEPGATGWYGINDEGTRTSSTPATASASTRRRSPTTRRQVPFHVALGDALGGALGRRLPLHFRPGGAGRLPLQPHHPVALQAAGPFDALLRDAHRARRGDPERAPSRGPQPRQGRDCDRRCQARLCYGVRAGDERLLGAAPSERSGPQRIKLRYRAQ
jgi:hypothetical protein